MRSGYTVQKLYSFAEREHEPKSYKECSKYKDYCLCGTSSCLGDFRSYWSWGWCRRCYYSWCRQIICNTLIVRFCCTFIACSIYNVCYSRITHHSYEFTIFAICLTECISCSKFCFDEFDFLSSTKDILHLCRPSLSWRPDNIATRFPDFCLICWRCSPCCSTECYHIWIFLLILIGDHESCRVVGPGIEKTSESFSYGNRSSIETSITTIGCECWVRCTIHTLVLTESIIHSSRCRWCSRKLRKWRSTLSWSS